MQSMGHARSLRIHCLTRINWCHLAQLRTTAPKLVIPTRR